MTAPSPKSGSVRTVDTVASAVVAWLAPEEKPYSPRLRDDFFARGGRGPEPADNPLGFGGIAVGLVTGVVLGVLTGLATESLTETARPWWERAWAWATTRLGATRRLSAGPDTPVQAPPERVGAITAIVTEHAVRANMSPEQVGELVSAVVAELTAAGGDTDGSPGR